MTNQDRERSKRFVDTIVGYCEQPGSKAAIRSGFRRDPFRSHRVVPYVAPFCDLSQKEDYARFFATATWVAKFGRGHKGLGLGRAVSGVVTTPGNGVSTSAMEKRLNDVYRTSYRTMLTSRLPHLLILLNTQGAVPDMSELLHDLRYWDDQRDATVRKWLGEYYRSQRTTTDETQNA